MMDYLAMMARINRAERDAVQAGGTMIDDEDPRTGEPVRRWVTTEQIDRDLAAFDALRCARGRHPGGLNADGVFVCCGRRIA